MTWLLGKTEAEAIASACKVRGKILNPSNAAHVSRKAANWTSGQLPLLNVLYQSWKQRLLSVRTSVLWSRSLDAIWSEVRVLLKKPMRGVPWLQLSHDLQVYRWVGRLCSAQHFCEWRPRGLRKTVVHCRIVCYTARLVFSCVVSYKNKAPCPLANSFLPNSGHQIVKEGLKSGRFSQWAFYRQTRTASISRGFSRQKQVCRGYKVKSILLSQPRTLRKWMANLISSKKTQLGTIKFKYS